MSGDWAVHGALDLPDGMVMFCLHVFLSLRSREAGSEWADTQPSQPDGALRDRDGHPGRRA